MKIITANSNAMRRYTALFALLIFAAALSAQAMHRHAPESEPGPAPTAVSHCSICMLSHSPAVNIQVSAVAPATIAEVLLSTPATAHRLGKIGFARYVRPPPVY